jgi:hypothetical protein
MHCSYSRFSRANIAESLHKIIFEFEDLYKILHEIGFTVEHMEYEIIMQYIENKTLIEQFNDSFNEVVFNVINTKNEIYNTFYNKYLKTMDILFLNMTNLNEMLITNKQNRLENKLKMEKEYDEKQRLIKNGEIDLNKKRIRGKYSMCKINPMYNEEYDNDDEHIVLHNTCRYIHKIDVASVINLLKINIIEHLGILIPIKYNLFISKTINLFNLREFYNLCLKNWKMECGFSQYNRSKNNTVINGIHNLPCKELIYIFNTMKKLPHENQTEIYKLIQIHLKLKIKKEFLVQYSNVQNCPFCIDSKYYNGYGFSINENHYKCITCNIEYCKLCLNKYNINKYSHKDMTCNGYMALINGENEMDISNTVINDISTKCPDCRIPIEKSEGCNLMSCIECRIPFCYLCGLKILDKKPYDHFSDINIECYQKLMT